MSISEKLKKIVGIPDEELDLEEENVQNVEETTFKRPQSKRDRDNKFLNINATAKLSVVLVKPERFEDASDIANHLIAKRTVLLNVEGSSKDVVRRLIDFLSGVAYAQGGNIKRVANGTYIITPYDVDIMGDILDELKTDGMVF